MTNYKPTVNEDGEVIDIVEVPKEPEYENVGWRNRIVGYAEVDPNSLLANESNWRTHPMYQREVVGTALEEVGWVQDIVVNVRRCEGWQDDERIDTVVDGHLRVLLALQTDQPTVPVKYVDLTPDEEKAILLILDPSSALATADKGRLKELLNEVEPMSEATKQMLIDLASRHRIMFDEEETLTAEDEFGEFSEYGLDEDSNLIDFRFGDYKAKISQSTYDLFVEQVNETKNETGEVMLDNVIQGWFGKQVPQQLRGFAERIEAEEEELRQEYGKEPEQAMTKNWQVIPTEVIEQVANEFDMEPAEILTGLSLRDLDEKIEARIEELVKITNGKNT